MKFEPEFKDAISQLTSKDKDKLILRLLKRDAILADQLYFELVSGDTVQGRRSKMETRVKQDIERASNRFRSLGHLLIDARSLSAEITIHVKVTKDKYGDASLNLLMLTELLKRNNERIVEANLKNAYKLSIYIIARAFKLLILVKALHEDYLVEFEDGLKELGELIYKNPRLMSIAIHNGFDVNWLLNTDIPENISAIQKDIRSQGFLK